MIEIKQHGDKWRIKITEEFEFDKFENMTSVLQDILSNKADYGKLSDRFGEVKK